MTAAELAFVAALSGVGGWALEWALTGAPRYSAAFQGARVPFLPVYAAGGAIAALLAPEIRGYPWPVRGAVYAASLTALEAVFGLLDRATDHQSWSYDGRVVDAPHALAWGALGLGLEHVLPAGGRA